MQYTFFDLKSYMQEENIFLGLLIFFERVGRLFINKPDQPNEDQYEFYRLDLSKIKKP